MSVDKTSHIKLDQFLKLMNIAQTGGEAKVLIQSGFVEVNGDLEVRRGRKLVTGDRVTVNGETFTVETLKP
ncbi:MAG: RNA-binding S4 domain-containing protein [Leptolyngbyaceae bacterium]|nr:RNA-binding S4 domain-containing protein [Leptolyngbyaceae bacterium]